MAYSGDRFVTIVHPVEARAIHHGLTLAIQEARRNGNPVPPAWVIELQEALRRIWDETKVDESETLSQNDPVVMMDVVRVSKILGKTVQAVTADCRERRLDAVKVGRSWEIDSRSVEALVADRKRTHA